MTIKKLILPIIGVQLAIVVIIGYKIYINRNEIVLGQSVVNPIKKETVKFTSQKLKNFYEPIPNTEDVVMEWHPNEVTYKINNDGLRDRYNYNVEKSSDIYRIVTLGDSYTFGLFVDDESTWSEKLEDLLNTSLTCNKFQKYEVINLGVHGYDLQYALERFKTKGVKYNPDTVIWLIKRDDVIQINEFMLAKEIKYREMLKASGEFDKQVAEGNYYVAWNMAMKEVYDEYSKENIKKIQSTFLSEFDTLFKGTLIYLTFNDHSESVKPLLEPFVKDKQNRYYFDSLKGMTEKPELFIPNDGHPTAAGHKVIADDVYKYLTENNIIPCE